MFDPDHVEAHLKRFAPSPGDDGDAVSLFQGQRQRVTVLGVKSAQKLAFGRDGDAAVGHHAVYVEYEGPYAGYVFLEISHMCRLMFSYMFCSSG